MKQVGEAVRDFSLSSSYKDGEVITIGVATWGTIHNREGLVRPMVSGHPGIRGVAQGAGSPQVLPGAHGRDPVGGWASEQGSSLQVMGSVMWDQHCVPRRVHPAAILRGQKGCRGRR